MLYKIHKYAYLNMTLYSFITYINELAVIEKRRPRKMKQIK